MLIPSSLMQSMASFVSQNVGAGNKKRAEQSMFTGIGIGLVFGCAVFALVWCKGDVLSGLFTADAAVIANSYAYLMGFAPETIATAILFSAGKPRIFEPVVPVSSRPLCASAEYFPLISPSSTPSDRNQCSTIKTAFPVRKPTKQKGNRQLPGSFILQIYST